MCDQFMWGFLKNVCNEILVKLFCLWFHSVQEGAMCIWEGVRDDFLSFS